MSFLRGLLVVGLLLPIVPMSAQGTTIGTSQNPRGVVWHAVEAPHVQVLAPAELRGEAQRVAATIEHLYETVSASLKAPPRRLTVVLQNRGTQANGFVTLMPRRSEWFSTPPMYDGLQGSGDWYGLLATHEFRHVVQFEKLDAGFTRVFSTLLGEPAVAFLANWSVPPWFWEGDAVTTETALTHSGRGRMPSFDAELRALLLERELPYWSLVHRSFRLFYPDHYAHGYALTSTVRAQAPVDVWDRVLARTTARAFNPWALSSALSRETGVGVTGVHAQAMTEWAVRARRDADAASRTPVMPLHRASTDWLNVDQPQLDVDGSVVVRRSGLDEVTTFWRYAPGDSIGERVQTPGPSTVGEPHSVANGRMVWEETRFDKRWGQQSYGVVMLADTRGGMRRQLGDTTRWFSPALSPDGARVAVVEWGLDNRASLLMLDTLGRELQRWPQPDGDHLVTPRFTPDGTSVLTVRIRRGVGRCIDAIEVATGAARTVVPCTSDHITAPASDGRVVYFGAPIDGRDEIFAIDLAQGTRWQVTTRPVGATSPLPSADGRRLIFNDWTAHGRRVVSMAIDSAQWRRIEGTASADAPIAQRLAAQEGAGRALDSIPETTFPTQRYRPWRHVVNPFGLSVLVPPLASVGSVRLLSQDVLSTTGLAIGADFDHNERTATGVVSGTYAGFYPLMDVEGSYGGRTSSYPAVTLTNGSTRPAGTYAWRETKASLGLRLPLTLTRDLYNTYVVLQSTVGVTQVSQSTLPNWFGDIGGTVRPVTLAVTAGRGYATTRDLFPVWGQYATLISRQTPIGGDFRGQLLSARGRLFLPGLWRHQGIRLDAAYEAQQRRNRATEAIPYRFGSAVPFARGYASRFHERYTRLAADYALPLAYPDLNIAQTLHVRRVWGALFADHATGVRRAFVGATAAAAVPVDRTSLYRSAGAELWADTRWFHLPLDIPVGVRVSRRFDGSDAGTFGSEFLVSLTF